MAEHIGTRVRSWRARRQLSQRTLADLAGVSQAFISKVETGVMAIDRRSTLVAVASALQVSVSDLLGEPDPTDPNKAQAVMSVPALRVTLAEVEIGDVGTPQRSRDQVIAALDEADLCRVNCDYAQLGPLLPPLLRDAAGYDPAVAAQVLHLVATFLRSVGYRDLAWRAADMALAAARNAEDLTLVGAVQFKRLLCMPVEAAKVIATEARRTYDALEPHTADPGVRRGYGMLHLVAGFAEASSGRPDDLAAHITEAQHAAESLGEPEHGGGMTMSFGPTNVGLWHMAAALELGEHQRVIEIANGIDPSRAEHANRQSMYWLDLGRAMSHVPGRDRDAVVAFAQAERAAPQYIRALPAARNAVAALIGRARQRAVADDLRRLADRVGVATL